ncbi:MAG: 50S ribosomal protein L11 methyltransferase [Tissierellaceae bacterium]
MKWTEIMVITSPENEDIVSDILYDAGATGLAIEDPRDIMELSKDSTDWDFVDPSLIKIDLDKISIKAYFSESQKLNSVIDFVKKEMEKVQGEIVFSEIDEKDWAESWKKYYKPRRIGTNIVIKPTWESIDEKEGDLVIELDPGMAFGTGTHETTMMCIESLEKFMNNGDKVYDIGCGSGILSIAAAKLGASDIVAVDLDPDCIKVSNENILKNKVEDKIQAIQGNLLDVVEDKADVIVSNIIAEIIVKMSKDLREYLVDNGIFIASGIILEKIKLVEDSLVENGFEILEIRKLGEWACIVARK